MRGVKIAGWVLAGVAVLLTVGWLSLRRGDIDFDTLDRRYATADSRFVDLPDGVRMHYRDQGRRDGPVIVLVHGFAASLHTWEPWVADLGRDHRVISLDLPGYGLTRVDPAWRSKPDSYVQAIDGLAQALKLDRFTLAGNSMGGAAAWNYALAHPERLDALVLEDAAGWPQDAAEEEPLAFRVLAHPLGRALLRDLDASALMRSGLQAAYADDALVTDTILQRYVDMGRAPGRRDQILDSDRSRRMPDATPAAMAQIRTPTLVLTGEEDLLVPAADARRFAETIPGARLIAYPGIGHLPHEEIPARSASDVREFLQALRRPAA